MAASLRYLLAGMSEWNMMERRLGHSRKGRGGTKTRREVMHIADFEAMSGTL